MRSVGEDEAMNHRHVCVQLATYPLQDAKGWESCIWNSNEATPPPYAPFYALYLASFWFRSIFFSFFPLEFQDCCCWFNKFRLRHRRRDCDCMGFAVGV